MLGGRRAAPEVTSALALVGATALWYLIGLPGGFTGRLVVDTLFTVLSAGAALLCLWTWRRLGSRGRPWLFIGLGCLSWFCGMLVWDAYELVLQVPVPYPSVADLGCLGFYTGFYTGLFLMLRQGGERIPTSALVLDASIVAIAASTLFLKLVLHHSLQRLAVNELDLLVSMAWGAGTFGPLFLSALALAWRIENLESRALIVLLVGSLAFTIANVVYGRLALEHAYFSGHPVDLAWIAGFVLVGLAAVLAARSDGRAERLTPRQASRRLVLLRALALSLSTLGTLSIIAVHLFRSRTGEYLAMTSVAFGVLVALRLGLAVVQGERLDRRTRERDRLAAVLQASTTIASKLGSAELLQQLAASAARAVDRSKAVLYVYDAERQHVETIASFGLTPSEQEVAARLAELPVGLLPAERRVIATKQPVVQTTDLRHLPTEVVEQMLTTGRTQTLITPLLAHGEVIGVLDLWTPGDTRSFDPADIAAAVAIGQEAGLAIYNMRLLHMLQRQADTDGLTGLLNHRAILQSLEQSLVEARRTGTRLAVLLIDLDGLKQVNDAHGHLVGDSTLIAFADLLRSVAPKHARVGRYGGDEFLIVVPGAGAEQATLIAHRLQECASAGVLVAEPAVLTPRFSMGFAVFPHDGLTQRELIAKADAAMYAIKKSRPSV